MVFGWMDGRVCEWVDWWCWLDGMNLWVWVVGWRDGWRDGWMDDWTNG